MVSALILAGGQSRRMGSDKALVVLEGMTLLERVCQVARHTLGNTAAVAILTPWPERYGELSLADATFLIETDGGRGPLGGLELGLRLLKTEWALVLACDLPWLEPSILNYWQTLLTTLPTTTQALLPHTDQGWEPLCGYYRVRTLPYLSAYLAQGHRSCRGWLETLEVAATPAYSPQMLFNCNTLQEWESARINR